jgi:stalled ribosome rescue protein Dom34
MDSFHHAVVWIDHREAKVYRFSEQDEPPVQLNAHHSLQHLHHLRGGWEAGGKLPPDDEFFGRVAGALGQASRILVTGPGDAKLAFKNYLDQHRSTHAAPAQLLELVDHPGDAALLALGRQHLLAPSNLAAQETQQASAG